MTILYIVSGLYLGWLLGTNDTINVFGASVNLKMLNFKTAAFIASLFVIIGAIFQGEGTTSTIHSLGNISEPAIAFVISLCVAICILVLIKIKLPVSTSQAIVGGMMGWSIFIHATTNWQLLSKFILAWILAPVIGMFLGMLFFFIDALDFKASQDPSDKALFLPAYRHVNCNCSCCIRIRGKQYRECCRDIFKSIS